MFFSKTKEEIFFYLPKNIKRFHVIAWVLLMGIRLLFFAKINAKEEVAQKARVYKF